MKLPQSLYSKYSLLLLLLIILQVDAKKRLGYKEPTYKFEPLTVQSITAEKSTNRQLTRLSVWPLAPKGGQ